MAALSPALSNNSTDTPNPTTAAAASTPPSANANNSKNLRGLNKPKCIKCGNVARSRCPYQSCKSCCAKAQNPCHIHVLKGNSTFPDKAPLSNSPLFHQQSTEVPSSGNALRVASLRQLSNNFSQFNNLQTPLRSRKPLTRKEATVINEWRFLKLKEYKERNIEVENEAFDRYMQNISLLEEVFSVSSTLGGDTEDVSSTSNANSIVEDSTDTMIAGLKLKLRSNPLRTENFRKRMQYIVDQGLRKLKKFESNDSGSSDFSEQDELVRRPKKFKSRQAERVSVLSDLIDKLNKARNEEDLKACLEMKSQLFNNDSKTSRVDFEEIATLKQQSTTIIELSSEQQSVYSPPKCFNRSNVNQDVLNQIDARFSSIKEIEEL